MHADAKDHHFFGEKQTGPGLSGLGHSLWAIGYRHARAPLEHVPAKGAKVRRLGVGVVDAGGREHHAALLQAVGQAEGMADLVDGGFFQAIEHQSDVLGFLMELGPQAVQGHQGAGVVDPRQAKDKGEDRDEEVDVGDPEVLVAGRWVAALQLVEDHPGIVLTAVLVKGGRRMVQGPALVAGQGAAPGDAPGQIGQDVFFDVADGKKGDRCSQAADYSGFSIEKRFILLYRV